MTKRVTTPPYLAVPRRRFWWLKLNAEAGITTAETH